MIKIIHIIPCLRRGGAERLVLDIVSELTKKPDMLVKLIVFSDINDYSNEYPSVNPVIIPSTVSASFFRKWNYNVHELSEYINAFKPDIIHTHLFEAEFVSRAVDYSKATWFSHCHDNMIQFENFSLKTIFSKRSFTNYYEKRYLFKRYKLNKENRFIAISNHTKKYFESTSKHNPVSLLHNSINYDLFYNTKDYETMKSKISLINTGSFVDKKNQAFLIDVVNELKNRKIDFELHLLGDGVNKAILMNKVKYLDIEKAVYLHGNVQNVEEYLWQSDIYVHSATYEPLGLVLLEAMAAGLPVVCLDGGGNRDIIEEGKNGFMIDQQDPVLFADKIIELINNKELYAKMSLYAQEFAKKYDIKDYVDKLLKLYSA